MQIINHHKYLTPQLNKNRPLESKNVQFKANLPTTQIVSTKTTKGLEYCLRIIINKFTDFFQPKTIKEIIRNIANIKPAQTKIFLEQLSEIGRLYSTQKIIDVNIEDKILEQIAQNRNSAIFIMNHSNQNEDPQMLAVLNTLLCDAYKNAGNEKFPLPKIILNEDILKTMNPIKRKAFENFGAVGIDASLVSGDKNSNTRAFLPVIKDFIRNKCNIFIFPEGRLAIRNDLNFFDRFQGGTANLINKILAIKKSVLVVPIAFSYGGKTKDAKGKTLGEKNLNSINIGTPIEIKRKENMTTITCGDILKDKTSCLYNFFDKNKENIDIPITNNGITVKQEDIADYLKTILCENLEINIDIANKKLCNKLEEKDISIY